MDLHRRIRTLRLRRGLTGMELARRSGVSPSYISLIEHGEKVPSEQVAVRLAQVLGEKEDIYRIWAATARMDAATRDVVLRSREYGASVEPLPLPDEDSTQAAVTSSPRRPPGRPPRSESRASGISYRLEDDDRLAPLRIPLLAAGSRCLETPPPAEEVECRLAFDPRLLGRESATNLVALRVSEDMTRDVSCWIGSQDVVVVDRHPTHFDPARIHAFLLGDGLRLSRACLSQNTLLLLPLPTRVEAPRALDVSDADALSELLFGTVIWSGRNWVG